MLYSKIRYSIVIEKNLLRPKRGYAFEGSQQLATVPLYLYGAPHLGLALRWEDAHLETPKPALLVRRTLTRGEDGRGWVVGASTKSGKGRRVRLTRRAVTALKDHRKRQVEERMRLTGLWRDKGLVFPTETSSLFNPSNLRNRSLKRIEARAGAWEDLRFHDLRHTCATLLLGKGVNAKVVSEMLGHASITITLNTYSHVLPDMQDSAADAMESALS